MLSRSHALGWLAGAACALFAVPAAAQDDAAAPACIPRAAAPGSPKQALVIANAAYGNGWSPLQSPAADSVVLEAALRASGFSVAVVCDGSAATMRAAIADLGRRAQGAEVALVYIAGHGFEYAGRSFYVPIGAPARTDREALASTYIDGDELKQALAGAGAKVLLLDACRTAFVPTGTGGQAASLLGDAYVPQVPRGALVFSTGRGQPAFDASPPTYRTSPFAASLAEYLPIHGLELADLFRAVDLDVRRRTKIYTNGPQKPWMLSELDKPLYINRPDTTPTLDRKAWAGKQPSLDVDMQQLEVGEDFAIAARLLRDIGVADLLARAERNDAMAQYFVAYLYQTGLALERDEVEADKWLQRSAARGNPAAQAALGLTGVMHAQDEQAEVRGRRLLEASARQGFARANYYLAVVSTDPAERKRYLSLAAEDGDPYAAFQLASSDEPDRAIDLLQGIYDSGDEGAAVWLCELSAILGRMDSAVTACEAAAQAGVPSAQAHLATLYAVGRGKVRSPAEARHWGVLGTPAVYFELDRGDPVAFNAAAVIGDLVEVNKVRPIRSISVEAHLDGIYSREYAISLGSRMASRVVDGLTEAGFSPAIVSSISYGRQRPRNKGFGIQPLERRVDVVVRYADEPVQDPALPTT